MIETDGGGDDGIGGGEDPTDDGNEMHAIEDHPISDGQTLVLTDIAHGGGGGEIMPLAAVVTHGETIVIAFDEDGDDGGDPADERNEGEDEDANNVDGLPEGVAEGESVGTPEIGPEVAVQLELEFSARDEGFRLLAEVGEKGGAKDEKKIFK